MDQPIQVFCCYAREDQPSLLVLKSHLSPLQRDGLITVQADIDISPGEDWEQKINHYLNTAQMVLLLTPELDEIKFQQWRDTKRAFIEEEIAGHTWIKIANSGNIFMVRFSTNAGGTLTEGLLKESPLSDPNGQWGGSWKLIDGMLRISISSYELDIFANAGSTMHSGIEFAQDKTKKPHAYFTLLPLQWNKAKHWPLSEAAALVEQIFKQILERSAQQSELITYGSLL